MLVYRFLSIIFLLFAVSPAFAQLQEKQRGRLGTLIHRTIFVDSARRNTSSQIVDEEKVLRPYNGMTIGEITFERHDVFEKRRSLFQKAANGIHARTLRKVVRNDLLFKEGDVFDAALAVRSNQILQSRNYISRSLMRVLPDANDSTKVNIQVVTFDSWTISVNGGKHKNSRVMGELYDVNFLGSGIRLGVKSHLTYNDWRGRGEVVEIASPNFLGTFYEANLSGGRAFDDRHLRATLSKGFVLPTDYAAGASASWSEYADFQIYQPEELGRLRITERRADAWGGISRQRDAGKSFYLTGHYSWADYPVRPADTDAITNPLFHERHVFLTSAGFYRERFYSSSLIYGYGFQEYIAAGWQAELVGGASLGEFSNYYYTGGRARIGGFWPGGYLSADISAGSFWKTGSLAPRRSVINAEVFWFSNLLGRGNNRLRQFVTISYTQGWNMGRGAGTLMGFSGAVRPVGFKAYGAGRSRLLLNTETVVFTRHRPFGFRLAVFGFGDAGLIGMDNNPFRNDFFSTFGVGIRFKNERLIFNALQLRLGFAVGKSGFVRSQVFRASTEQRIEQVRFVPSRAEVVPYK